MRKLPIAIIGVLLLVLSIIGVIGFSKKASPPVVVDSQQIESNFPDAINTENERGITPGQTSPVATATMPRAASPLISRQATSPRNSSPLVSDNSSGPSTSLQPLISPSPSQIKSGSPVNAATITTTTATTNFAAAPLPMENVQPPAGTDADEVWELPPGVKAPMAFYETGANYNSATVSANEQIAQNFETDISGKGDASASGGTTETSAEVWENAVKRADESYRVLFGEAAYNQRGLQATGDARSSALQEQAP